MIDNGPINCLTSPLGQVSAAAVGEETCRWILMSADYSRDESRRN